MVGDIFRVGLLILAVMGFFAGVWPALAGMTGTYIGAAESTTVHKTAGVTTSGTWFTEEAPSLSWIHVSVTANYDVEVRIVAMSARKVDIINSSGFPTEQDTGVIGGAGAGFGEGKAVDLKGSHGGPTRYMVVVLIAQSTRLSSPNITERDLDYNLKWEVQKLDPLVFLMGLVLFAMFFVTEYMIHLRGEMKGVHKRLDKLSTEGFGVAVRAPSGAFGIPPAFGAPGALPPREERARRGMFGRGERDEAPPAPEEVPVAYGSPAPSPPPQTRYAVPAPEPFAPPPASVYSPPPAYSPAPAPPPAAMPAQRAQPAPAPAPAAPTAPDPVSRVRCPQCKHIVPVYTAERPTPIKCPNCGKRGMLTK